MRACGRLFSYETIYFSRYTSKVSSCSIESYLSRDLLLIHRIYYSIFINRRVFIKITFTLSYKIPMADAATKIVAAIK